MNARARRTTAIVVAHLAALAVLLSMFLLVIGRYWRVYRGTELDLTDRTIAIVCLGVAGLVFLWTFVAALRASARERELHWQTVSMGADDTMWRRRSSAPLNFFLALVGAFVLAGLTFGLLYVLVAVGAALWGWSLAALLLPFGGLVVAVFTTLVLALAEDPNFQRGGLWRTVTGLIVGGGAAVGLLMLGWMSPPAWLLGAAIFLLSLLVGLVPVSAFAHLQRMGPAEAPAAAAEPAPPGEPESFAPDDNRLYRIVRHVTLGQFSVIRADWEPLADWEPQDFTGTKQECFDRIAGRVRG